MSDLFKSFEKHIKKHAIFSSSDKILVAVSGGIDSVVLAHLLAKKNVNFGIAHCNFGLREEANQEEDFVKKLADSFNVQVYTRQFMTQDYAANEGISIQMAARELRYDWFTDILNAEGFDLLATAHHANDQLETILFNWTKGTGISGLRGMELRNDKIIRPLLFAEKIEIIDYAEANHITWMDDISNTSDKYHRNRIRNQVLPQLKEINPSIEKTSQVSIERLRALEQLLNSQTENIKRKYLINSGECGELDMHWFDESNGGLAILEKILVEYNFNFDQCQKIVLCLRGESGKQFSSDTYHLTVDRNRLFINPQVTQEQPIILLDQSNISCKYADMQFLLETSSNRVSIETDPNLALLDAEKVKFPISIRQWREGDYFRPLGMRGKKKVSDFMIDLKIPVNLKKKVVIFESQGEIIWIAGHRISDDYKLTSETQTILRIKMSHGA